MSMQEEHRKTADQEQQKEQQKAKLETDKTQEETPAAQPAAALGHPSYEELEEKLTAAEQKAEEYWNQVLRAQAELENVRRRAERDVANAHKFGIDRLIGELLPVLDSLEQAMMMQSEEQSAVKSVVDGIELTLNLFLKALAKFGVEQVNPLNQEFNPAFHEAISVQEAADAKPNTVIKVLQKGYLLNQRLLRPALVVVAKS